MQYLLIICHDEYFAPTRTLTKDILAWNKVMERKGIYKYGNPLRPPVDAKTVRVRKGKLLLTNGPFSDSNEKIAAYVLLDCSTMQEAIDAASQHPMARAATIEVRPVWEDLADFI